MLVRFMVDADGTISKTEVLQSDGEDYSREVISVPGKNAQMDTGYAKRYKSGNLVYSARKFYRC